MPRRDGTGPMGAGPMTGRGFGPCAADRAMGNRAGLGMGYGYGRGRGCGYGRGYGRGFGRGFAEQLPAAPGRKEMLEAQKSSLQDQLAFIEQQLDEL